MSRDAAAKMLSQLLATDAVGALVDTVDDADVRDLLLKAMHRCRGIAADAEEAAKLAPPTGGR